MSRIYIAGPMTGIPEYNRPAFFDAAAQLVDRGHTVLNPATLPNGLTQPQYMDICCAMLRCADAVFLLEGWEQSAGARAERALAEKLELGVIFQEEWLGDTVERRKDESAICNQQICGL
ncbi:DUF4406 domain-containing protein [Lelliottia wanjuensis]|uniref:DUF4406 domain-containing protein n=1 Tax=Lelliottia wanjuensis TaxID=3050585 RepID=A0AAP4D5G1_9ENTR|nr:MULTISPECIES: DUF4406 domain-containing protein [unclassified Lelliottia]MDK9364193.1 DUF4406 domain-containing protein [Lelliottia sp. V106_12]MDK9617130.1 DUF4406 domain-containing protein [Lelliottia sp. V106_9]